METKAGDPGAFAQFDLDRVSSPAQRIVWISGE